MNIKLFKIIFVILITITAITEGLYLFALPYLLNKELSSGKINSTVQQKTGLNLAFKNTNVKIKGLTAGDFATVKKKNEFLDINTPEDIINMLQEEVKVKRSETLKNTIGF